MYQELFLFFLFQGGRGRLPPSIQWRSTLMDERPRGNSAAAAGQGRFGLFGLLCPSQLEIPVWFRRGVVVKAAG